MLQLKKNISAEFDIPATILSTIIKNKDSITSFASKLTKPAKLMRNRNITNKNV